VFNNFNRHPYTFAEKLNPTPPSAFGNHPPGGTERKAREGGWV